MIKAPVFAVLIATIGCYMGLQVEGNAESVGRLTTQSVVVSIFAVIVVDALFSCSSRPSGSEPWPPEHYRGRNLVTTFGAITVHDGLSPACAGARSWPWSAARAPASRS